MSIARSIAKLASVTRNEQRYAMPPGALLVKYASTSACATGNVVAAGDDAEHAGRVLVGIGGGVERPVVGRRRDLQRGDRPVCRRADSTSMW